MAAVTRAVGDVTPPSGSRKRSISATFNRPIGRRRLSLQPRSLFAIAQKTEGAWVEKPAFPDIYTYSAPDALHRQLEGACAPAKNFSGVTSLVNDAARQVFLFWGEEQIEVPETDEDLTAHVRNKLRIYAKQTTSLPEEFHPRERAEIIAGITRRLLEKWDRHIGQNYGQFCTDAFYEYVAARCLEGKEVSFKEESHLREKRVIMLAPEHFRTESRFVVTGFYKLSDIEMIVPLHGVIEFRFEQKGGTTRCEFEMNGDKNFRKIVAHVTQEDASLQAIPDLDFLWDLESFSQQMCGAYERALEDSLEEICGVIEKLMKQWYDLHGRYRDRLDSDAIFNTFDPTQHTSSTPEFSDGEQIRLFEVREVLQQLYASFSTTAEFSEAREAYGFYSFVKLIEPFLEFANHYCALTGRELTPKLDSGRLNTLVTHFSSELGHFNRQGFFFLLGDQFNNLGRDNRDAFANFLEDVTGAIDEIGDEEEEKSTFCVTYLGTFLKHYDQWKSQGQLDKGLDTIILHHIERLLTPIDLRKLYEATEALLAFLTTHPGRVEKELELTDNIGVLFLCSNYRHLFQHDDAPEVLAVHEQIGSLTIDENYNSKQWGEVLATQKTRALEYIVYLVDKVHADSIHLYPRMQNLISNLNTPSPITTAAYERYSERIHARIDEVLSAETIDDLLPYIEALTPDQSAQLITQLDGSKETAQLETRLQTLSGSGPRHLQELRFTLINARQPTEELFTPIQDHLADEEGTRNNDPTTYFATMDKLLTALDIDTLALHLTFTDSPHLSNLLVLKALHLGAIDSDPTYITWLPSIHRLATPEAILEGLHTFCDLFQATTLYSKETALHTLIHAVETLNAIGHEIGEGHLRNEGRDFTAQIAFFRTVYLSRLEETLDTLTLLEALHSYLALHASAIDTHLTDLEACIDSIYDPDNADFRTQVADALTQQRLDGERWERYLRDSSDSD